MVGDTHETLRALVDHELALQHLYTVFASTFDEDRHFWLSIAGEEQGHADKLEGLGGSPGLELWLSNAAGLRVQAVESSIEYVRDQALRAQTGEMSRLQALVVAKDVEDALIDKLSLLPDPGDCAEINRVLAELRAESQRHRESVVEALEAGRRMRL